MLGKAHYGVPLNEDSSEFTAQLIRRIRAGTSHERFFTKAAELVGPLLRPPAQSSADFWDSVAFANYIPETVGQGVHDAPTDDMWHRARVGFVEILNVLAPTHVLSLGKEQWNAIAFPPDWTSTELAQTDAGEIRLWQSGDRTIVATPIDHPTASFGFSPGSWTEHLRVFLDQDPRGGIAI